MNLWEYACALARADAARILEAKRIREENEAKDRAIAEEEAAEAEYEAKRALEREEDAIELDRAVDRYYGRTGWNE